MIISTDKSSLEMSNPEATCWREETDDKERCEDITIQRV